MDMKSGLIDTLFLFDKRMNVLLFLASGQKSSEDIKRALDFPWKSMIPQINKLVKTGLVAKEGDMYRLSGIFIKLRDRPVACATVGGQGVGLQNWNPGDDQKTESKNPPETCKFV
ncbi:TPA: hypothetical protein HA351_10360 [Methanosarcinaceae archaeon]|nr:hypothetical protein [Methanosarcinaceae archaeon]